MELKQLRHFTATVEAGSLSRATKVLNITQPALTRSIKNLEGQLQAILLERKTRGVLPTEAGTQLYQRAKMILNEASRAAEDVGTTARGEAGSICIGVAAMWAGEPMATVLAAMAEQVPDLKVNVVEGGFEELITDLRNSKVEAILSGYPIGAADNSLVFEPLINIKSHFVVSSKHPLARQAHVPISELRKYRLAIVGRKHVSMLIDNLFESENLGVKVPDIETNSLSLLRTLVLSHNYVSVLPERLLEEDYERHTVVRLPVPGTPFKRLSGLVMRHSESRRPGINQFIGAIRKTLANEPH